MAALPLPVVCLMGPTAAGKTALALALHTHLPFDIVSVDSSQVYRGMDIGTAKPSPAEQAQARHYLIDIRDPSTPYSAAEFCRDARHAIDTIHAAGRIPLLVGGTMFYFRALEQGLSELPSADPLIRRRLSQTAQQTGWPALHKRLAELDPAGAARIQPNDAQRIQRALEIIEITGHPIPRTTVNPAAIPAHNPPLRFIKFAICPRERYQLHEQIAARFHKMLAQGLLAEVQGLHRRSGLTSELPSMRTVGYRQALAYFNGVLSYPEMIEKGIIATRQLAKRQLTWLRADKELYWLDAHDPTLVQSALEYLTIRAHL